MNNKNDFVRNNVLLKDEKVLWEGRPRKIAFFEKPHTNFIILNWIVCVIFYILAYKYWAYTNTILIEDSVKNGTTIFLMVVGALFAISPYKNIKDLEKSVHYIVTDKRVVAYMQKGSDRAFIQSRNFEDISEVTIINKDNGMGDLYIGDLTKEAIRKNRKTPNPVAREEDRLKTLVFYNIHQPQKATKYLPLGVKVKSITNVENTDNPDVPNDDKSDAA